ncbi:MAG: septum formation initiator family protein [Candidatus Omnitrophota bacterium]
MLKNPFFLFGLGVVLLLVFLPSYQRMQDLKQKNREYELGIQELVQENSRLSEEKRLLEEDPVYLEKVAREKMGLIREGEVIYKIVPAEEESNKKP